MINARFIFSGFLILGFVACSEPELKYSVAINGEDAAALEGTFSIAPYDSCEEFYVKNTAIGIDIVLEGGRVNFPYDEYDTKYAARKKLKFTKGLVFDQEWMLMVVVSENPNFIGPDAGAFEATATALLYVTEVEDTNVSPLVIEHAVKGLYLTPCAET